MGLACLTFLATDPMMVPHIVGLPLRSQLKNEDICLADMLQPLLILLLWIQLANEPNGCALSVELMTGVLMKTGCIDACNVVDASSLTLESRPS